MSDGSSTLQYRDPDTFELVRTVEVVKRGLADVPVTQLNELECVGDDVYANLWQHRYIVRINGQTGDVTGWIDTGTLLLSHDVGDVSGVDYLNGIAYVPETRRLLLTGKYWPAVFDVAIVQLDATRQ
jgi:glutamine cyclotransferase